jgi:hypothetical protein
MMRAHSVAGVALAALLALPTSAFAKPGEHDGSSKPRTNSQHDEPGYLEHGGQGKSESLASLGSQHEGKQE